ncbi:HIT family protein [Marinospirillum alkaliphilum]|uniref:Diadenosine tetraphosphate (Ap4A) hydrolase n=1 Tax=Marinospirillum alkaliphilum DSM 21637 TaxID=1122209 RepID=A0A1K1XHZ1_9GAMM|nr:HIT family protein [Marinospirillum alkaliphilum]SFX49199.1 Diadenosine tetraphosphate (Ap4A) hydrolase [Marinospirillum alkaliphilum DSM 21637]
MTFELHPRLAADSLHLGDLPLCQLRLMNDQRFYWLLLIPRLADAIEVTDLNEQQYVQMWQEVRQLAEVIKPLTSADKLNVATLGNMVPQLHLHLIARFKSDAAWPGPIWGVGSAEHYTDADISQLKSALQQACDHLPIHWV